MIEPAGRFGRWPEAVFDLVPDRIDLFERDRFAEALVDLHAQASFVDILFGKAGIEGNSTLVSVTTLGIFPCSASMVRLSSLQ